MSNHPSVAGWDLVHSQYLNQITVYDITLFSKQTSSYNHLVVPKTKYKLKKHLQIKDNVQLNLDYFLSIGALMVLGFYSHNKPEANQSGNILPPTGESK